jgi:hypothetical protein
LAAAPDGWSKESLPTDGTVLRLEAVLFEIDLEFIYLESFYHGVTFGNN